MIDKYDILIIYESVKKYVKNLKPINFKEMRLRYLHMKKDWLWRQAHLIRVKKYSKLGPVKKCGGVKRVGFLKNPYYVREIKK